MSVREAQERISSREFAEWQAFLRVEPLGDARLDYWMASMMAMLANLYRDPKQRRRPYRVREFWPEWWRARVRRSWRDLKAVAKMVTVAFGGTVKETQE